MQSGLSNFHNVCKKKKKEIKIVWNRWENRGAKRFFECTLIQRLMDVVNELINSVRTAI